MTLFKCCICGNLSDEGDAQRLICLRCIDSPDPETQKKIEIAKKGKEEEPQSALQCGLWRPRKKLK